MLRRFQRKRKQKPKVEFAEELEQFEPEQPKKEQKDEVPMEMEQEESPEITPKSKGIMQEKTEPTDTVPNEQPMANTIQEMVTQGTQVPNPVTLTLAKIIINGGGKGGRIGMSPFCAPEGAPCE